jgi:hypothetical protein
VPAASTSASQLKASAGTASASARASAPPVPTPAPALERDALNALRSGHSVHINLTTVTSRGSSVVSQDSTTSGGRQVFTIDKTSHMTILLIAGVGYVHGDSARLQTYLGVPQAQADQYANQWISMRPGDKLGVTSYADVVAGITLPSFAGVLEQSGQLTLRVPATIAGQRVVGVQSTLPASAELPATARNVLYVTDNAQMRPVLQEVMDAGRNYEYQNTFSHWGETVHLTAPANPVPASSITPASTTA